MQLVDPGPSISRTDLAALEHLAGFPLAKDYRAFLLHCNGGRPEAYPTVFRIEGPSELGRYMRGELSANATSAQATTPEGYVWHHMEDQETLQLVPHDVHLITGRHVSVYQFQEKKPGTQLFIEDRSTAVARPAIDVPASGPCDMLQVFFRVRSHTEITNIDWNYRALSGRIARDFLPVACDGSGNLICMALSGRDCGSVYLWDWYSEDVPPSYKNVYFLAHSFESFLAELTAVS